MNKALKFLALIALTAVAAQAQTATVESIVTDVGGITTTAGAKYVIAAGLGVAVLTVGVIVKMSRRGWSLK